MKNLLIYFAVLFLISSCQNSPKPVKEQQAKTSDNTESNGPKSAILKAPTKSPSPTTKLEGIDVSSYQSRVEWNKVKADNINFVFVKATGGETYVDPLFKQHWDRC